MSEKDLETLKTALDEIKSKLVDLESKIENILKVLQAEEEFGSLPWRKFRSGKGSWIHSNTKGAENLLKKLKNAKGNVIFTDAYKYELSKDGRFIRRFNRSKG